MFLAQTTHESNNYKRLEESFNYRPERLFEVFKKRVATIEKAKELCSKGAKAVGSIENFVIGKEFNDVGRTTSWYNDIKPYTITIDGCTFLTSSNIAVLESTYTLGVTNEYWELISNNVYEIS